jgi:hypothetical protein
MVGSRWLQRFGPPGVGLGLVAVVVAAGARATAAPVAAAGCDPAGAALSSGTRGTGPVAADLGGETWYAIDPELDGTGDLVGQRLRFGPRNGRTEDRLLPPESFVAGPFGQMILVGTDDGRTSTVRAVVASTGCEPVIATAADVVRTATLHLASGSMYEFRVDRVNREDLGVWRRPAAGGPAERVLEPLAADERFGPTFSTTLSWAEEADALIVQSCGLFRCRSRVLDVVTGTVRTVDDRDQGEVIGAVRGRLIAYAACRGLPCDISSTDIASGQKETLAHAAGLARLVPTDGGASLVHESVGSTGLVGVDVVTGAKRAIPAPQTSVRLVPDSRRARAGTRLPRGWALLTPDARARADEPALLVRVDDGATIPLPEAQP